MLILFDYDGVIVDSFALLLNLCIQAQKQLVCGRRPVEEAAVVKVTAAKRTI